MKLLVELSLPLMPWMTAAVKPTLAEAEPGAGAGGEPRAVSPNTGEAAVGGLEEVPTVALPPDCPPPP
jgi:hypothetical protein